MCKLNYLPLALAPIALSGLASSQAADKLPNVIYILADDMGIGDLGCYGQKIIQTPNIDALAKGGLKFTNHHSGSTVSAPSRCVLMTGKHTGMADIRGNTLSNTPDYHALSLKDSEVTVAEIMKSKGYATMCVGKWGLGGVGTSGCAIKQGFDYFFGYYSQLKAHNYYPDELDENETTVPIKGKYSHFVIMEKGLEFIDKNADKPIFAYFAITPPHSKLVHPDMSKYKKILSNVSISGKDSLIGYSTLVGEVDRSVGQIIDKLKEHNIYDNTIIIVTSDNGTHMGSAANEEVLNSNGPFRGFKRSLYEGGVRTPFIVSWPAKIKQAKTINKLSGFWDFLPTMADLVDVPVPEGVTGTSYLPILEGNEDGYKEADYVYFEFYEEGGKQSIKTRDGWKLVRLGMNNPDKIREELYYIPKDVSEKNNLLSQKPEIAQKLRELAINARTESDQFEWSPTADRYKNADKQAKKKAQSKK